MNWQEALTHICGFLLLPLFVGSIMGVISRVVWFRHCSFKKLISAGIAGCLAGLITGWILTGQDGHMLGYALLMLLCSLLIMLVGSKVPSRKPKNGK